MREHGQASDALQREMPDDEKAETGGKQPGEQPGRKTGKQKRAPAIPEIFYYQCTGPGHRSSSPNNNAVGHSGKTSRPARGYLPSPQTLSVNFRCSYSEQKFDF